MPAPRAGSECGNLLARIPAMPAAIAPLGAGPAAQQGEQRRSLLLCAHLDTVPLLAPVEPVLVDGYWENANEGDPRRRQQGGDRRDPRARTPYPQARLAARRRAAVHGLRGDGARRLACVRRDAAAQRARLRLRPRDADRRGRSSTRRRISASRPTSAARPRTPGSARRTVAARSSPPRARSRRCGSGGSTSRARSTSARSPAAAR